MASKEGINLLFLDGVRFPQLRTVAPIETKTENPRPLAVMNLHVTRTAFWSILTLDCSFPMQVEIGSHSKNHRDE